MHLLSQLPLAIVFLLALVVPAALVSPKLRHDGARKLMWGGVAALALNRVLALIPVWMLPVLSDIPSQYGMISAVLAVVNTALTAAGLVMLILAIGKGRNDPDPQGWSFGEPGPQQYRSTDYPPNPAGGYPPNRPAEYPPGPAADPTQWPPRHPQQPPQDGGWPNEPRY